MKIGSRVRISMSGVYGIVVYISTYQTKIIIRTTTNYQKYIHVSIIKHEEIVVDSNLAEEI